jgi:transcriptional regulator with XRE-family HTH domain
MKERLQEFLRSENKSSAQFAEEIGVQPSGISHILSGRNKPSLDFVLKMLEKYKFLSTEWLLFGKGSMYKDLRMQSLFDEENAERQNNVFKSIQDKAIKPEPDLSDDSMTGADINFSKNSVNKVSSVARIVWFYSDNSFEEYLPRN